MEQEKLAKEQEEKEQAEKAKKMKEEFTNPAGQWEQDKTKLQDIALKEKKKEAKAVVDAAKELPGAAKPPAAKEKEKVVARDGKQEGGKT
jgi:mannan polymerase II complex ANP1 subunit